MADQQREVLKTATQGTEVLSQPQIKAPAVKDSLKPDGGGGDVSFVNSLEEGKDDLELIPSPETSCVCSKMSTCKLKCKCRSVGLACCDLCGCGKLCKNQ